MKIYETDQWTAQDVTKQGLAVADVEHAIQVQGKHADVARSLFCGGYMRQREVQETHRPPIGHVWFKADEEGRLQVWRANYDSSD